MKFNLKNFPVLNVELGNPIHKECPWCYEFVKHWAESFEAELRKCKVPTNIEIKVLSDRDLRYYNKGRNEMIKEILGE